MSHDVIIQAQWDGKASVWIATSIDVPGLVVEGDTWPAMIEEVRLVLPELMELSGDDRASISLTFKAETHLSLAGA